MNTATITQNAEGLMSAQNPESFMNTQNPEGFMSAQNPESFMSIAIITQNPEADQLSFTNFPQRLAEGTQEILGFWLETLEKKENSKPKEFIAYLKSWGWNPRAASSYIRLAKFIRSRFPERLVELAQVEIRTLLKLPLSSYKGIVEAMSEQDKFKQNDIEELIRKHKPARRANVVGFKQTGEGGARLYVVPPLHNEDGVLVEELATTTGLTVQKTIVEACRLAKVIGFGSPEERTAAIAQIESLFGNKKSTESEDVSANVVLINEECCLHGNDDDIVPDEKPSSTASLKYDSPIYTVQWRENNSGVWDAGHVLGEEDGLTVVESRGAKIKVESRLLQKIDPEYIKLELEDPKKIGHPYSQTQIKAVNAKRAFLLAEAARDPEAKKKHMNVFSRWIMLCEDWSRSENGVWYDWEELRENQRLVFIPGGEDWIADKGAIVLPTFKLPPTFAECMAQEPSPPSVHDLNWEGIGFAVEHNNTKLTQLVKDWTIEQKSLLITKLCRYLDSHPQAIKEGKLNWLNPISLEKALKNMQFAVGDKLCTLYKLVDFGTPQELWVMSTSRSSPLIDATRNEVNICGVKF